MSCEKLTAYTITEYERPLVGNFCNNGSKRITMEKAFG